MPKTLIDKWFKDKNGRLALVAAPNSALIIWGTAAVASHLARHGILHSSLSLIAFIAIIAWSLLEIFQGINYFRRALGSFILALTIYSHLN